MLIIALALWLSLLFKVHQLKFTETGEEKVGRLTVT